MNDLQDCGPQRSRDTLDVKKVYDGLDLKKKYDRLNLPKSCRHQESNLGSCHCRPWITPALQPEEVCTSDTRYPCAMSAIGEK